ncbi:MAG: LamG domain-containing protein, partial [Caldilineaceae bacterium]|nr:LamG domain-containing protein [Caldilineaceae bacterium]
LFTTISQSNRAWTQDLWFKTTQQNAGLAHRQTNTKRLFLENGNVCAQVEVVVANANQADKICSSGVNYADDDWHHLSHTADNGVHRLYVDGALAAQSGKVAFAGCSADTCANFTLGQDSAYFAGAMDAARFFDRALSRAEVADAFDAAVAIYDLDEPAGAGTFVNATDNGFDATCSGDSCPTMGVPGVAYTAARFDGVDDFMQVDPAQREVARFSYDFESGVPPAWNIQTTGSVTREGQPTKFLGLFENNTVKLNLQNLPVHDTVEVQFDLYLRGVWTGNNPVDGPDTWAWGVDGQDILRTNFSTQTNMNGAYQF